MKTPVRILIVEDIASDVDLAKHELGRILNSCEFQVVDTYEGFIRAIETFQPDVIISDYTLPRFDGLKALALAQKHTPLTPFIIWTGSMSENLAIEFMRAGANNYIFKDDSKRLAPAVVHALEERTLVLARKQAEEALQINERRFRALIENGLDDISLLGADGSLLWESPSTIRNLGYQPDEFVGHNIFELVHPDDLDWTYSTFETLLQKPGDRQRGNFRLRRSDGTWRWVEAIATNMLDDSSVNAIVVNYRDITEQKQAEFELQKKNDDLVLINTLNVAINRGEKLEMVVNHLRDEFKRIFSSEYTNIYLLSPDRQSIRMEHYSLPPGVKNKIERLIGRSIPVITIPVQEYGIFQDVLRSKRGRVISGPDATQKWMGEFLETVSLPPVAKLAIRKLLPQLHKILNIRSTILVPLISDGEALGLMNVSGSSILSEQDLKRIENIGGQLTIALQRRQMEDLLSEERNLLRTLIDNLPDRIYATDRQGRKTLSNSADWKASGMKTMEEVIGRTDLELYPPEMAEEFWRLDKAVLDSGQSVINCEEPGLDSDGNPVSILTTKIPLRDDAGRVIGLVGIGRDITERKQAEAERQALLEIMQGLANTKDLQDLLKLVHQSIAKVIYAENFFIVLYQESTGMFEEIYTVDQYDPPAPPATLGDSITSYVFRSGEPLLLTQTLFDELEAKGEVKLIGTNSASWLGVPLKTSGKTIGVIAVQDYENDNRYSEREKDFLTSIATQIALVIERKQAETAEREQRVLAEALRDTAERLSSTLDYGEVLDHILNAAGRVVPHDAASILIIEGESARVVRSHGHDRHQYDPKVLGVRLPLATTTNLQRMLKSRQPEVVNDTYTYPGWHRMPETDWLRSSVSAPISIYGEIIGFICLDSQMPEYFTPKHAERLEAFANQAAIAVQNARLLQQAQDEIAERRRSEMLLRQSEERFSSAFEYASIGMALVTTDGRWLRVNGAVCRLLGYSETELLQKTFQDITHPDDLEVDLIYVNTLLRGEVNSYQLEKRYFHKSGHLVWVLLSVSLVRDDLGKPQYFISQIQDITERKHAEASLKAEQERAQNYLDIAGVMMLALDLDGTVTLINQKGCELLGYSAEEIVGKNWIESFLPKPIREEMQDVFQKLISDEVEAPEYFENSILTKNGEKRLIAWHNTLLRDARGRIISSLSSGEDITERKRAEEEIRRRAEETAALLETSLALTNLDLEATLQTIGNSANTLFLADGCRIFLSEPDGETLRCVLALQENTASFSNLMIKIGEGVTGAVAASGKPEIVNEMQNDPRAIQVQGTEEELEAIMFAPLKERDRTIGILSIRRVGENRQFQPADLELLEAFASMAASAVSKARLFKETQSRLEELRASEERFRQLADNVQEAFWITDAEDGEEIYMSPAIETIWGRPLQSMMKPESFLNTVFPEDRTILLDAIEKEKRGEKMQFEYRVVRPDGSLRWIWDRAFPIFDEAGNVKRIAGISADITERKEAAEKLRESEDRYHSLFQNQLHGSALHEIVTNEDGQPVDYIFLKINPAFEKMTGLSAEQVVGRRVTEVLPGIENERLIQVYGQVALTGEPAHLSEYFAPLERYYEINAYATGPRQFAVSFVDVTERRQTEQELRKLSRAVEQSSSTIVITDTTGKIEYVNPKFTQVTGYSLEEAIGHNPRILKSGFTADEEYTQLWQTIFSGREWHGELLNKKKDGTLYWESVTISPIMNDNREITHFVGVKEDITERKQSEIEIRRHIAELEAVYENGLSVGRLLQPTEIGNRVIETFARYLPWHHVTIRLRKEGSDDLELVAFNLPNLKEEEREEAGQHFVARINKVGQGLSGWVIQTGNPFRTGNVYAHPQYIDTHAGIHSGLYMPLKVGERVIGVISVESEAPDAFTEQDERLLATLANQTAVAFENARLYEAMQKELAERKRAEDALRMSETHYRDLANSITDILFELDQDFRYTHWNKASELFSDIPAEHVIGKTMQEVLGSSEEQSRREEIYRKVLTERQATTFETEVLARGQKRALEINAYPSARGVSVVAKDVTDRKRTEAIMQKRLELMEYSAKHSLKDLMQKTVDEVSELTGSTIGFFHFMEEDQIRLGAQTWSTNALQLFHVSAGDGAHLPLDQAGVWAEAVRERRPLIHNNYESLSSRKGVPPGHVPIIREMVIPIIRNESIMAVMGIGNKPQDYTSHDLEIAARLADYAWDITERKQMEIALELERNQLVQRVEERTADLSRANSNLARALRVKDEFLANMSHELRTPLNAILGLSESLGEQIAGPLNEKQQKYISTISESGHHLLSLINDILDLAKIDAGHITLDINKMDIRSVCNASLRMIKQLAQKKNQQVFLEIDEGLGLMWADERRLKQMIVNLLGNAVKFTPENGNLGLEVHGDEEANQISITVWDNGIGIHEDDLTRLFQPFVQLDSGLARESTGTGLGLALVAQMARLHGGGVAAVSEAGKGSRFTIILPWEPALAIDTASRMKITGKFRTIQTEDTNKPKILLVEDTQEVVMMIRDYLELTGYKVFTAQDGIDGIVQARHVKPDLILMDVQMPRMDGFETTRKLRSDPNFKFTPIIALTALAMPHDRERCLEAGMNEYISKPVNLKALVKIIQSCLLEKEPRTR